MNRWPCFLVTVAIVCLLPAAHAANWEQPAAALARQIAALTGPGPARLTLRNDSSLAPSNVSLIGNLLARDLAALGVPTSTAASAPRTIQITLSQNLQGGLWVAAIGQGSAAQVTMLPVALPAPAASAGSPAITLRRTLVLSQSDPVLDAAGFSSPGEQRLIVLEPSSLVTYTRSAAAFTNLSTASPADNNSGGAWTQEATFPIPHTHPFPRDLRGRLVPAQDHLFDAYLPGIACRGTNAGAQIAVTCMESDDPWPLTAPSAGPLSAQKAFYNTMRDWFTGVLAPGLGVDLPPFYEAAELPRTSGSALLVAAVDGQVSLVENATLEPVTGADDWGSDFAVVRSGCGSGAQVLVSGSGAASEGDSLRAWEILGRQAVAVSPLLPVDGAVMALWPGDSATATVIVRRNAPLHYEVWNASVLCH